ncbi:conserved hypothetical protein [Desulfonatronospira thiodismutans ASO3-1]|uniref:Uncharacterized protein n=1 Tax=Desulfonatronospira thiodismutans ASO3-1 TaxID=555779 RepID=D6SJU0_9BACT|nr:hypothetical protein [Desulfonatronospira thiodismutans]EFI36143.1 conserved hypothetical protein [Desulfonatronospira thiodismutans ASO3-1]
MRTPFDPLKFLQSLRLNVELDSKGQVTVHGIRFLEPHKAQQARNVLQIYDKLLRMQLDAPSKTMRPSVRKLLALGKVEIRDGQYTIPEP